MAESFVIDKKGQEGLDAYLEYTRIVGDDDNGRTFSDAQYEAYKKKWIPIRMKNRIYVSWHNPERDMDCKLIGPQTPCFCGHRYINHKTDFEKIPNPIKQKCKNCACDNFHFVPKNGSQPIRCTCKHFPDDHDLKHPYGCKKCPSGPKKCKAFKGSFTCDCGAATYNHIMVKETKAERIKRGKPVGKDVPYKAMGGLTGFSSLAPGVDRLDPSGIGPSSVGGGAPIQPGDHPFLKMHAQSLPDRNTPETQQLQRRQGETDMEYFDRLYKWKQKTGYFLKHK